MTLPEFPYIPEFLSTVEEEMLLKQLSQLAWKEVKMHGIIAKRRVIHFGLDYEYNTRSVKLTTPIPNYLKKFLQRAASFLTVGSEAIKEILITEYPPGAGIGWHRDAAVFGDKVFGISLLNPCVMKFKPYKNGSEIYKITLEPRSAYIIQDNLRWDWLHSISPVKKLRYSITFRTLKE